MSNFGPRDPPDVRDRHIRYDEDDDGISGYLPELRDESAFHRGEDDPDHEDEEQGL